MYALLSNSIETHASSNSRLLHSLACSAALITAGALPGVANCRELVLQLLSPSDRGCHSSLQSLVSAFKAALASLLALDGLDEVLQLSHQPCNRRISCKSAASVTRLEKELSLRWGGSVCGVLALKPLEQLSTERFTTAW